MTVERERYELEEGPAYEFSLGRRGFLQTLGGGLLVVGLLSRAEAQESGRRGSWRMPQMPEDVNAWLHIGPKGGITVYTGKVEVGQNARTALTQAVAEELRSPVSSIAMIMGDTDLTPFDMGTFGSQTTPRMSPQLRRAAVAAREALIDLAAKRWNVERAGISVRDCAVFGRNGRKIGFGELTRGEKLVRTVSSDEQLTPAADWKIEGTPVPKIDARDFVTGKHKYPADMRLPEMMYGKIVRPSAFGATLVSADTKAAQAMRGVVVVRDGDFLGLAAPDPQTAEKAADAIQAQWKAEPQPSNGELFALLKTSSRASEPQHQAGSIEDGMKSADFRLRQSYDIAYIAHTPLEPRAALAHWTPDGRLTVWTGTQRPFGVRSQLAEAFHIPESKVHVLMPDMGSGYGGKHTGEAAVEAARLAKSAGKPVKVLWTREEEFTWAYFRPAGVVDVASGVTKDGLITAWEFHNYNSGPSGMVGVYDIANQRIEFHPPERRDWPLRQGSYRALASTGNHFARESHMDELAHAVRMDPLEFRLKNLKDERLHAALTAVADRFGWGKSKPGGGRGFGIAGGFEKNGYVATAVELTVDSAGKVKLHRAVAAFDCGAIVNPDGLKNQVEGALIMGIGGALFESIRFANGRILNAHLAEYRVPRFRDVPSIETILIDRRDVASAGAGESPIVALAPAIANAIFAATGERRRAMPMMA
jgi:CO/xanthine dehydrogenase Mo-binding subunit